MKNLKQYITEASATIYASSSSTKVVGSEDIDFSSTIFRRISTTISDRRYSISLLNKSNQFYEIKDLQEHVFKSAKTEGINVTQRLKQSGSSVFELTYSDVDREDLSNYIKENSNLKIEVHQKGFDVLNCTVDNYCKEILPLVKNYFDK